MAKREGAGGGFGWLMFGLLVGAIVLLTANALLHRRDPAHAQDAVSSRRITIVPIEAPRVVHPVHAESPTPAAESAAPSAPKADDAAQMADDAAAAGMTSRTTN